ncbi:hypothetical protein [Corynebacterium pseudotuberculosis]|uniref:hypothetical protein n=1 Tax=Corynebacterium pseudotuberculosis TaxID=1719 RepID=UPI000CDC00C6|nr:hypothetical protein [Corynebacterium pseudotuberculosis]AUY58530.1 Putative membrane protein [Corynebacterium pseudotuberculosis]
MKHPETYLAAATTGDYLVSYVLFLVAGLLVGGVWSAFKAKNTLLAVDLGACALAAIAGGIAWAVSLY